MARRYAHALVAALLAGGLATSAHAGNRTFKYDALGRLEKSTVSSSTKTVATTLGYDPAGNRSSYESSDGSAPPAAPVPLNPSISLDTGGTTTIALPALATVAVPAAVTAFSPPSGNGTGAIAAGGQSVTYTAPILVPPNMCEPAYTRTFTAPYTVQNTPGGASASGTVTFNVKSAAGPLPTPPQLCPGSGPAAPVPLNPTISLSVSTGTTTTIALATLATVTTSAAITAFSPPSGNGTGVIAAGGQSVTYTAPYLERPNMCEPAYTRTFVAPYTVQNTPGGASASGTATFKVKSQAGPRPVPPQVCP